MQITKVEISSLKLPLNRTFKTAIRTTDILEDLLLTVYTDEEIIGYGSAPATTAITGDTLEGMQAVFKNIVIPNLIGINPLARQVIYQAIFKRFTHNTGVKMALDIALFDIAAKAAKLPLYAYLGGAERPLTTDVTISCANEAETKEQVALALNKGYRILKIKLGQSLQQDIKTCVLLANILPNDCVIRIDANQGWTETETMQFLDILKNLNLNIELIEQPIAANNLAGLHRITKKSNFPIMADEAVFDCFDAKQILQKRSANLLNIKLAKSGGILQAIKIKYIADSYFTECMVGCMMESPIGIAAAAHFAQAFGITKIDLDPLDWIDANYYSHWLKFSNGLIQTCNLPGLGYIP